MGKEQQKKKHAQNRLHKADKKQQKQKKVNSSKHKDNPKTKKNDAAKALSGLGGNLSNFLDMSLEELSHKHNIGKGKRQRTCNPVTLKHKKKKQWAKERKKKSTLSYHNSSN